MRVTALAAVAVIAVLVAAGALLVVRHRADLIEQLDESLALDAQQLADLLANGATPTAPLDDDRLQIVGTSDDVGPQLVIQDEPYRVAAVAYTAPDGSRGLAQVAAPLDDVDESIGALIVSLAWIIPLATAVLAIIVWVVVGRTLRPVERIRAEVAGIGIDELDRRVPQPSGHDEIARLAATMNDMLGRLHVSARRQRRFVGDAAHELRTPLARMRAELEVDARNPTAADADATRLSQLEELADLQQLTDDLLTLARTDDGGPARPHVTVDLDDIVLDELRSLAFAPVEVDGRRVSAAQVRGDRDDLRRVVRNLLDNAARHARSTVAVELAEDGDNATLTVDDDGPGIPVEQRTDVFERFARLDQARSGDAGGTGLGLAIVHDLVARHGGTIVVDDAPLGGARFVVTLPR